MNLSIIIHLLKTDWQRLRRPLLVLWLFLPVAALPWLLHGPGDRRMPRSSGVGWNSRLGEMPAHLMYRPWSDKVIIPAEILSTILALILASMLGAQWVKRPVTPIRGRERLSALAISLLVFIVLPQWILAFSNLLLHGFFPGIAALAAGATALTAWLLLGLAAAFAAWLPSVWLLLAGWAVLYSSVGVIAAFYPALRYSYMPYPSLPLLPVGPKEWLFGTLAITLLAVLFPMFRARLNGPWKIVVAVALILVAALPAWRLPYPDVAIAKSETISTGAIHPSVRSVGIQTNSQGTPDDANEVRLTGTITSIGCPPGYAVNWAPAVGSWISQDGRKIATFEKAEHGENIVSLSRYPDMEMAAVAALPNGRLSSRSINPNSIYTQNLGTYEIPSTLSLLPDREAELHVVLTGTVYRFEKVWDVPLGTRFQDIRAGNLNWRVREFPSDNGEPRAEVSVIHPALGISNDADELRWNDSRISNSSLYFHLPATGDNIRAEDSLMSAAGPLYSGAGWDRAVLAPSNQNSRKFDLTGLRLILLKPVAVAQFTRTVVVGLRAWATGYDSDFTLTHRQAIDTGVYRCGWFPQRPDPKNCTREEFARWLRVGANVYPGSSGSEYDLASFAPRFAGLLAKVGYLESVGDALRVGTPESQREEVIREIDSLVNADRLADVALSRGWLDDAKTHILRRFDADGIWDTDAVMALEEPSTYPKLISRFIEKPALVTYEKLRLLPGIEPQLGDAITKAARETDPRSLKGHLPSYQNDMPYGPFLFAAKLGEAAALEIIIDIYRNRDGEHDWATSRDLGYIFELPDSPRKFADMKTWLQGKSAASFRFDPLLRLWKPLP